jgi:hypothetical protein
MKSTVICVLALIIHTVFAENFVNLNPLSPEEARSQLEKQSLDLRYAQLLGQHPIPYLRSGEAPRQYWYNGRMIDNPADYIEEEYLANQFHGQDGEGRALFGYTDWNQARVEAINGVGDVRGSFKYIDPNGEEIETKYWADTLGFHREDNRPVIELIPVTDTPSVRAAKEAHEVAWKEAASRSYENPDPNSDLYNRQAIAADEERSRLEQQQELARQSTVYEEPKYPEGKNNWQPSEPLGPPHGFFYSFDYPVSLIKPISLKDLKGAAAVHDQQTHPVQKRR